MESIYAKTSTQAFIAAVFALMLCASYAHAGTVGEANAAAPKASKSLTDSDTGFEGRVVVNPHVKDKQPCATCHTQTPPKLTHDAVTTCTKCHASNMTNHPIARHRIDIKPVKAVIPKALPLSSDGKLVCSTCHDPHGKTGGKRLLRLGYDDICRACHTGY